MNKISILMGFATIAILSSCGSKPYKIEQKTEISVPSAYVFEYVANNKTRSEWSPWSKIDPDMTKEYEGPASGVGAKYSWSSENEDVGTGSMICVESTPSTYMKSDLSFSAPHESSSVIEWNFSEKEGVTSVSWSVSGELPGMAALFVDMDEILTPKLKEGLANLKTLSEANYKIPEPEVMVNSTASDSTTVEDIAEEEVM